MQARSDTTVNQNAASFEEKFIESYEYKALEQKLILALINHNQPEVISIINSSININALLREANRDLPSSKFCGSNVKKLHQTLLHLAINVLDLTSVQFLLQNGADPNILNSDGQSTIEVLFAAIGDDIECSYKHPDDLSENRANIVKAEKIIDLLLCFGLNYNKISWTKHFLKKCNELKQNFDDIASTREEHYKLVTEFRTMPELPAHKNQSRLKRTMESCTLKLGSWLLEREFKKMEKAQKKLASSDQCMQDWLQSTSQIFESLKISSEEVKSEKQALLTNVQTDIDEVINHPRLPSPLMFLIMEYAHIEFATSIKLAETRFKKSNKTNFWIKTITPLDAFDAERYRNIIMYATNLQIVLKTLEQGLYRPDTCCSSELFETIAEYAIDGTPKADRLGHSIKFQ